MVYLLSCLTSPQKYFRIGEESFIDLINIAPNAESAKNIFFDTLNNYMWNAPLFNRLQPKDTRKIVTFPKNIRLVSGNSEDESWQGYNPILIVLDEIDAFKSEAELQRSHSLRSEGATGIYQTAKSLIQSRFPGVGKVLCLSWPRFKGSFIQQRFDNGKNEARTYVAQNEDGTPYATWEFNPIRKREDFEEFFRQDPVLANARYKCQPPFSRDAFIKNPEFVLSSFDAHINNDKIVWARNKTIRNEYTSLKEGMSYYIHVDLGFRHANAALGVAHREGDQIIVDLIKVWKPTPGMDVEFKEIENFIIGLRKLGYHIGGCTYDHYQSIASMQALSREGIPTAFKSLDRTREVWDTFKDLLYQRRIDGYFDEPTIQELLGLDIVYGDKIEARPGLLKDRADAIAGAIHGAVKTGENTTRIRVVEMSNFFDAPAISSPLGLQKGEQSVAAILAKKTDVGFRKAGPPKDKMDASRCPSCRGYGTLEYQNDGGRTVDIDIAHTRWCIVCRGRWRKKNNVWVDEKSQI